MWTREQVPAQTAVTRGLYPKPRLQRGAPPRTDRVSGDPSLQYYPRMRMKTVLVTGATGFLGRPLVSALLARGDRVKVLTRSNASAAAELPAGVTRIEWTPLQRGPWMRELDGTDVVVHLAGESIARRWTEVARREILASRVTSTQLLCEAIGAATRRPETFVCASAIGYYGPQPAHRELDEDAPPGRGFLADVVVAWERSTDAAEAHGVRTAKLRIGIAFGADGGPLQAMLPPFRYFLGGPVGDGRQAVSWIHRDDVVGMTLLAIDDARARGPINLTAPRAVDGDALARSIGAVLRRPSWLPVPAALLRLALGDAASILTTGQRVVPRRALELGYEFRHPELGPALRSLLAAR